MLIDSYGASSILSRGLRLDEYGSKTKGFSAMELMRIPINGGASFCNNEVHVRSAKTARSFPLTTIIAIKKDNATCNLQSSDRINVTDTTYCGLSLFGSTTDTLRMSQQRESLRY